MEAKINLERYAEKLATKIIGIDILQDRVYESILDEEDKVKVFLLVGEKIVEKGNNILERIKKKGNN